MLERLKVNGISPSRRRVFNLHILKIGICLIFIVIPFESNAMDWSLWSSKELKLRFSYDNKKWTETTPTQDSTVVVINWRSKKSGGLMGSCYLGAYKSGFGKLNPSLIHGQLENVAKSIKERELKRAIEYKQISLEKRYSDNHPIIYLSRSVKARGFDGELHMNIYSIITAWENTEIHFSCSSEIPNRFPQYSEEIERQLLNVLKTLQFDR